MEFLRKLLKSNGIEASVIKQIMADCPDMVTKAASDKLQSQVDELSQQLKDANKQITKLEKENNSISILEQQVTDLKEAKQSIQDKYDAELREIKIHNHVKNELRGKLKDSKYVDLLYKELDTTNYTITDKGVEGFDSKELEDKYPDLFCGDDSSLKNPPRGSMNKGQSTEKSLGARLAEKAKANTIKNPYF